MDKQYSYFLVTLILSSYSPSYNNQAFLNIHNIVTCYLMVIAAQRLQ
jgi:hypothetical protein